MFAVDEDVQSPRRIEGCVKVAGLNPRSYSFSAEDTIRPDENMLHLARLLNSDDYVPETRPVDDHPSDIPSCPKVGDFEGSAKRRPRLRLACRSGRQCIA
jgi:hypothetical protein